MPASSRVAFLLSQVGSHASAGFDELVRALGLSPADAGVLRMLGRQPGMSQRALADRLGSPPSRMVAVIDRLEARGLVTRTRSASDRRNYELSLTAAGSDTLAQLRRIAERHDSDLLAALSPSQSAALADILATLADAHGLDRDIHRAT